MPRLLKIFWPCLVLIVVVCGCGGGGIGGDGDEAPVVVTKTLTVTGMTCDSCEGAIQDAVGKMPGVVAVEANHETSMTTVVFDMEAVSEQSISETIEELGYSVSG